MYRFFKNIEIFDSQNHQRENIEEIEHGGYFSLGTNTNNYLGNEYNLESYIRKRKKKLSQTKLKRTNLNVIDVIPERPEYKMDCQDDRSLVEPMDIEEKNNNHFFKNIDEKKEKDEEILENNPFQIQNPFEIQNLEEEGNIEKNKNKEKEGEKENKKEADNKVNDGKVKKRIIKEEEGKILKNEKFEKKILNKECPFCLCNGIKRIDLHISKVHGEKAKKQWKRIIKFISKVKFIKNLIDEMDELEMELEEKGPELNENYQLMLKFNDSISFFKKIKTMTK